MIVSVKLVIFVLTCILFIGSSTSDPLGYRIVNGTNADFGEFPFICSLRFANSHICGCTILDQYWILTAAHCIYRTWPEDLEIQFGVTKISSDEKNVVKISQYIIHENYDSYISHINDIALLKVRYNTPIKFDNFTKPVRLPQFAELTVGETPAQLIGWGYNSTEAGVMQAHLKKVDLKIVSKDECKKLHHMEIFSTHMCAGAIEGVKGQCTGDSGGPLLANGVQVGIVSWSVKPCAVSPYPGVYTDVALYIEWIRKEMANNPV